ncbi:MAG: PepSY-associated TM helix domain-containing protein [Sphingorhabdus sp.]
MSKATLLTLHRCLALTFAPLLFLQALTGTLVLFRAELMRVSLSEPSERSSATASASVSAMVAAAVQSEPGYRAVRLFFPATPRDATFVQLDGPDGATRYVALDPANAQVLAAGSIWRFPTEAALQIHYRLLDGRFGMAVVLVNAVVLMIMSTTGMLYWWPGRQRLVKALAIRSAAPARARLRQWHRSIGVILTPVMLFSATTGLLLISPDLAAPAAPAATAFAPPAAGSIDRAFTRAMSEFPGASVRDIRLAAADRMDVNILAPRYNSQAVDVVSVRLSDGAMLKRTPAERNPAPWITWLPLHSGTAMGTPGRILLLIEGLTLMILTTTGPLMWWQARRPKRRKA